MLRSCPVRPGIARHCNNHLPVLTPQKTPKMKMTNRHTPGPWKVVDKVETFEIEGPTREIIGTVVYDDSCNARKCNARLIASAPEMLEALLIVQEYADARAREFEALPEGIMSVVNAAIARAPYQDKDTTGR